MKIKKDKNKKIVNIYINYPELFIVIYFSYSEYFCTFAVSNFLAKGCIASLVFCSTSKYK